MRYRITMRTTLEIDDDLVQVARQLAQQRKATLGQVVSQLVRKALEPKSAPRMRNGVLLFDAKAGAKAGGDVRRQLKFPEVRNI